MKHNLRIHTEDAAEELAREQLADADLDEDDDLDAVGDQLCDLNPTSYVGMPLAPTPTGAVPGTPEKVKVMADRVAADYAPCHFLDQPDPRAAKRGRRTINGGEPVQQFESVQEEAPRPPWEIEEDDDAAALADVDAIVWSYRPGRPEYGQRIRREIARAWGVDADDFTDLVDHPEWLHDAEPAPPAAAAGGASAEPPQAA